jgi:hypothetical protein
LTGELARDAVAARADIETLRFGASAMLDFGRQIQ